MRAAGALLAALALPTLGACATAPAQSVVGPVTADWTPPAPPAAVIVALHGFNDRKAAFAELGAHAASRGVAVLAYDQPGFGAQPDRGRWAGEAALVGAAHDQVEGARARFPDTPIYVLGESMGAALATAAWAAPDAPPVDGLVLIAPAVWGGDDLGRLYRATLGLAALVVPGMELTGRGLDILASDNLAFLQGLGDDPLYLKSARVEAIAGLVELMDGARAAGPALTAPRLVLTGARDEVVPMQAMAHFTAGLDPDACTAATYIDGWHLLLGDLQRRRVFDDILGWVARRDLPSGLGRSCAYQDPLEAALANG